MGFISSVGHAVESAGKALGKAVKTGVDVTINGPQAILWEQQLDSARGELTHLVSEYQQLNGLVTQYEDPINNVGKYTSAMLHQASDFVHGIAVNYQSIITDANFDNKAIKHLVDSNALKPLINLPIPGTMGGIPSALIPGVEGLKLVTGLANLIGGAFTLHQQVEEAESRVRHAHQYIAHEQHVLNELKLTGAYLIGLDNMLMGLFQQTGGIAMPRYGSGLPKDFVNAEHDMPNQISRMENLKGNAFRTIRFIQNVISNKKITTFNDAQRAFVVNVLMKDAQISGAYGDSAALRTFIDQFLDGSLVSNGMLTIPPVPSAIRPYLNEQPPQKQVYSDPSSSQFDPPSASLDGFPM